MSSAAIEPFRDALRNTKRIAEEAENGRPVVGYFCNYTPVPLIHACGFFPLRLSGGPGPLDKAYDLLPDFVCPFLKRVSERALKGELSFISGIVQGYTCDAACGVVNVLQSNIKGSIFEVIPFPYNDSVDSRDFFRNTLTTVKDKLVSLGGSYSLQSLDASIDLYSKIRRIIDSLYESRYSGRLPITAEELWFIVRAGEATCPEEYLDMLESFMETVSNVSAETDERIPVLVSGSLIEDSEILNIIERCGGRIVADDLCTGLRRISAVPDEGTDPLGRLIDMHFSRVPCPSRARAEDRLVEIQNIIDRSGAIGVLFLHQKFCSPHLSDFPYLSSQLKKNNIKSIQIEMDETWKASGQLKTRLEGFFEMLAGR